MIIMKDRLSSYVILSVKTKEHTSGFHQYGKKQDQPRPVFMKPQQPVPENSEKPSDL